MAKMNFLGINLKAATLTGAIVGLLAWLVMFPWYRTAGFGLYGMMSYAMGYASMIFSPLSVVVAVICGAAAGAVIAIVYNWALKL